MAITKLVLNGTEYEIGNITNITTEGPQLYDGVELSYTWAELKTKVNNADFDDLRIGDYKTISLTTGETVVMQIAGIDTYYKTTDSALGHHIDWISKDCLATTVQWNTSNNNNGTSENNCPYMASNVRSYLTETVYGTLPSDVKAVISTKRVLLEIRYSSSGTITDSNGWSWKNTDLLWLPSEYEVFGSVVWGTKGYSSGQACQYPIFANSFYHRIKGLGNGASRYNWWLSSVNSGNSTYCCYVTSNGGAAGSYASDSRGVPVCFRILAS